MIYLDYNATAPILPSVQKAIAAQSQQVGNPSSVHYHGVAAKQLLDKTRKVLANFIGAGEKQIVFTASGTESNALALHQHGHVLVEATAHPSLLKHPKVAVIPVLENGLVDLAQLKTAVQPDMLVSITLANNETGIIQDVQAIQQIVHKQGALLHIDASQAIGRLPLHFLNSQFDYMTVCFHKSGGPPGIAALVVHDIDKLKPLFYGGMQEHRRRAGTENMLALAGIVPYVQHSSVIQNGNDFRQQILKHIPNVIGKETKCLPNTVNIYMENLKAETQVVAFDLEGIAISAGAACSSGKVTASHVLTAMQHPYADKAIRVSWGWGTTQQEIDQFINFWHQMNDNS